MLSVRVFQEIIARENLPLLTSFEVTWKCNQRCLHCYQFAARNNELNLAEIKDALDQLAEAKCIFISFTGGEPLMRPDFWQIANYAKKKSFAINLQTNATLIGPREAYWLKKLNTSTVHVSLLGGRATTHDGITRLDGSWQKAVHAIRLLKKNGLQVIIKTSYIKQNYQERDLIRRLSKKLKVRYMGSPLILPKNNGNTLPLRFRLDRRQRKDYFLSFSGDEFRKYYENNLPLTGKLCGAANYECALSAVGDIYPCNGIPLSAGNIRKNKFLDIWKQSAILNKIRKISASDLLGCKKCTDAYASCLGLFYLEEGDFLAPSRECCNFKNSLKEVRNLWKRREKDTKNLN